MKHLASIFVFSLIFQWGFAQDAPNFTITDSDGIEHNLYEDYLDSGKIVLIDMFFVQCPICKPFNEPIQDLYEEFGAGNEDVEFFLLTTKNYDSNEDVAAYRLENGLTFPGSGFDGGGYDVTEAFRNGDFGPIYGSPTFLLIEPNKKVHSDLGASGVEANVQKIRERIIQIQNGGVDSIPSTQVNIDISHYKDLALPPYSISLRSGNNPDSSYTVPLHFTYPSAQYPLLSDPEVIVNIDEFTTSDITTIDLVLIQRYILGIFPLDNIQRIAADVNGSGVLTPADLISIRKVILHIQDGFSVGKSYLAMNIECNDDINKCNEAVKIDSSLEEQNIQIKVIKYGDIK